MSITLPFGETVLAWRVFRGVTQERLAKKAGVPRPNLSDIERGRREVTLGTLRSLAAALGVRAGVLADGVGPGREGEGLSREALERIARGVVGKQKLSDPVEKRLAQYLRVVVGPRLGDRRVPARRTDRAWLALRAAHSKEVIDSLVQRVVEKAGKNERDGISPPL